MLSISTSTRKLLSSCAVPRTSALASATNIPYANKQDVPSLILAFASRYNKQVLKVFPYPFTCTNLQVRATGALKRGSWQAAYT